MNCRLDFYGLDPFLGVLQCNETKPPRILDMDTWNFRQVIWYSGLLGCLYCVVTCETLWQVAGKSDESGRGIYCGYHSILGY